MMSAGGADGGRADGGHRPGDLPRFDLRRFLAAHGDDPEVVREILRLYREEAPVRLETIRTALRDGDSGPIAPAAHSLANTSGTLQSDEAVRAAHNLEQAAREGDLEACRREFDLLRSVVESILDEIAASLDEKR